MDDPPSDPLGEDLAAATVFSLSQLAALMVAAGVPEAGRRQLMAALRRGRAIEVTRADRSVVRFAPEGRGHVRALLPGARQAGGTA